MGVKKYKTLLGNLTGNPAIVRLNWEKMELLLLTAEARASDVGQANKLAEVLDHVLGVKKHFYSFGKFGREAPTRSRKSDTQKSI